MFEIFLEGWQKIIVLCLVVCVWACVNKVMCYNVGRFFLKSAVAKKLNFRSWSASVLSVRK